MIIQIMCIVLFSVLIVIFLMDIVPMIKDWTGRIYIGRFDDQRVWNQSITKIAAKWLKKTPKIKLTDNTRLVIIDILKGSYTKSTIQHWQEASLLLGLSEGLKKKDNPAIKNCIFKFLNKTFDDHGQWVNRPVQVDGAILAYAIMKLDFIHLDQYKKAFDYIWEMIKQHIGDDGTVAYRNSVKSYRFVDTVGFICPFLVAYGVKYHKEECIALAVEQIKQYEQHGMLEKYYIPSHAYHLENNAPLGLYGWGRGFGWFALGVIDVWGELPQDHQYKPLLDEIITKLAKAALTFQQDNGSWNWIVARNDCRPDSSATAALCWFMLNATRVENISKECLASANKAVRYLMKVTRRNGAIDFSQGDTKEIGVYSKLFNILPFTQGLCIRIMNATENNIQAEGDQQRTVLY